MSIIQNVLFVFSGTLVNTIGFEWMLVGISVLCFMYAPLLIFLRAPPTREEKKVGLTETPKVAENGIDNPALSVVDIIDSKESTVTKL